MNKKGLIGAVKYGLISSVILFVVFLFVFVMPAMADTIEQATPDANSVFLNLTGGTLSNISVASGGQYAPLKNYGFQINMSNVTLYEPGNCTFFTNISGTWTNYTGATTSSPRVINATALATTNVTIYYINFTQENFTGAGVSYHAWYCNNTNQDWNFTNNISGVWTNPYTIIANTSTSSWMNLTINNVETNHSGTYPQVNINATGNYSGSVFSVGGIMNQTMGFTLYRNDTTVIGATNGTNEVQTWATGLVNYTYNTSGNTNYSSATKYINSTITQNTSTSLYMNLTIANSTTSLAANAEANFSATYPQINLNATGNYSTVAFPGATGETGQTITFTLYRNDTTTVGTNNLINESKTWAVGYTNYTYNTSGNQNYSSATKYINETIVQNTTYKFDMYINASTAAETENYVGAFYNVSVNVSDSRLAAQNISLLLYQNITNITNPTGVSTYLNMTNSTADTWLSVIDAPTTAKRVNLTLNSSGNENYSANTSFSYELTFYGFVYPTCTFSSMPAEDLRTTVDSELSVTCRVFDNQTGMVIPQYNVSFLNNTGDLTQNRTAGVTTTALTTTTIPANNFTTASVYIFNATLVTDNETNETYYYKNDPLRANNITGWLYVTALRDARPIIANASGTVTNFTYNGNWTQLKPNYSFAGMMVYPNFTGGTFNGMVMPTDRYAPLTYNNKRFWEFPTTEEFLAYNLTFEVNLTAAADYKQVNVSVPLPSGGAPTGAYKNQTLLPASWNTISLPIAAMMNGTTIPSMNVLMKNPNNFTVKIYNMTKNNNTLTTLTGCGMASTSTCPNVTYQQGKLLFNLSADIAANYSVELMLGLQDTTCIDQMLAANNNQWSETLFNTYCNQDFGPPKMESSPVYITNQTVVGLNPFEVDKDNAPQLGVPGTSTFVLNVTNPLLNYTGENILVEYQIPINMTDNNISSTVAMTSGHTIGFYNISQGKWFELNSSSGVHYNIDTPNYIMSDGCVYNTTDQMPGSPMSGKDITMCYKSFIVNLSQANISGTDGWEYNDVAQLNISFINSFKTLNTTTGVVGGGSSIGDYGNTTHYNFTVGGQQGIFKLNSSLIPHLTGAAGTSACRAGMGYENVTCRQNLTVYVNGQAYSNWTTGSLIINSQQTGAQSVSVVYTVPMTTA